MEERIIKNYKIGGGTGDTIDAYIGNEDDFQAFISSVMEDMEGWVEKSQEYTLSWHDGRFIDVYNSAIDTAQEFGIILEHEERVTIFYEKDYDEDGNEFYIYGIYKKEKLSTTREEKEEIERIIGEEIINN